MIRVAILIASASLLIAYHAVGPFVCAGLIRYSRREGLSEERRFWILSQALDFGLFIPVGSIAFACRILDRFFGMQPFALDDRGINDHQSILAGASAEIEATS